MPCLSRGATSGIVLAVLAGLAAAEPAATPSAAALDAAEAAAFVTAIQACWVVDPADPPPAVTVGFHLTPQGRVVDNAVRLIYSAGGAPEAVARAHEAARRAILRCQGDGYVLPAALDDHWRQVELTFDPGGITER